jgi:tetratricopeptide (TPR) repeat protein
MTPALLALALALVQRPDAAALNERARQMAVEQRYEEAEKLWKQALEASPDFFPALFNLGFMYFSRAQHEQAEPLLSRAARGRNT